MSLAQQRDTAVRQTLAAIRAIAAQDGITHASLARIAERLQELAAQEALFPLDAFPPPRATPTPPAATCCTRRPTSASRCT